MALINQLLSSFTYNIYKIKKIYESLFRYFGWKIRYNSVLDCFDWMYMPLTLSGVCLARRIYVNDQVVFVPMKMTPFLYLRTFGMYFLNTLL